MKVIPKKPKSARRRGSNPTRAQFLTISKEAETAIGDAQKRRQKRKLLDFKQFLERRYRGGELQKEARAKQRALRAMKMRNKQLMRRQQLSCADKINLY